MRRSSTTQYQLITSAIILSVGSIVGVVAIHLWQGMIVDEAVEARTRMARGFLSVYALVKGDAKALLDAIRSEEDLGIRSLSVLDSDGRLLAGTPVAGSPPVSTMLRQSGVHAFRNRGGDEGLIVATSLPREGGRGALLVVDFDMSSVNQKIRRATIHVLGLVGTLALVNFLCVGWLVRRWMKPITELSRKMDEVQGGNLTVALPEHRPDEIAELARHFNAMLDAIRKARSQSLELARRQANIEKFAALGRLSSGVAHEINNPVGGILTALAVLRDVEPGSERYEEYLEMMRSGLERIASIVSQLLRFSRQPREDRKPLDLNALLEEVSVLARIQYRADRLHVIRRFGDIPSVSGSPDLLNQLFLNLAMNAFQEMPDGGILTITTKAEGQQVAVSFEDTGPGIPEDRLERIFEPFFTTKEVGEGTGLGLSVALGIVEAHGGTIEAANRAEGGARFTIRLPVSPSGPGTEESRGETP